MRFFDPFIILFFREIGFSYLQIGTLFALREVSNTLLEIPSGIVADFLGRKNSMLFSFGAYIVAFLIFSFFTSYYIFLLAMFLYACGDSFRSGTHKAMIVDYLKIQGLSQLKTEYYGSTRSWSQIGSALSSVIAGILIIYTGEYRIIFLASIFPYLLDFFILLSYPKELNGTPGIYKNKKFNFSQFKILFMKSQYHRALLNSAIYDGLFKSVKDYLQPILKSFALTVPIFLLKNNEHRSTLIIASVYFLLYFLSAGSSKNAHKFSKKFITSITALNMTFIVGIIITVFSGVLIIYGNELFAIISFITLFVIQNLRRPINTSYITEHIPENLMATGLSIETQIKTLTIAILSPAIGYFADIWGIGFGILIVSISVILLYPLLKIK